MRCFWIPRPRLSAVAPARTLRHSVVGVAAPRAVPAVRRAAGLMLFCVAGALPALELLREDVAPKPPAAAPPAADAARADPPRTGFWFGETGFASAPGFAVPMPRAPLTPPQGLANPLSGLPWGPPPRSAPEEAGPEPQPPAGGPRPAPEPEGGDPFVLTGAPVTPIPVPGAAALLLAAFGLALALVPRARRPRPGA